ncbi:E1 [Canine papillomavirus 22]|uniref:E1 n=1 Tax=Canine papillomavirus 22 TaxID=2304620 RepID=UPI000E359228|nr:E1 [Canine papillomavirus 22]AXQ03951.1 E1 [Canine papillomavirus 22]
MADVDGGNESDGDGGWFLVRECDCAEDDTEEDALEQLFDGDTDTDVTDLIDDTDCAQNVNHAALLHAQLLEADRQALGDLKRKYSTPSPKSVVDQDLSPQLQAVSLSPRKRHSKRRLFDDSGIASSYETPAVFAPSGQVPESQNGGSAEGVTAAINTSHSESTFMARFKDLFGLPFKELTRPFKSDKTCCSDWVIALFDAKEELVEAAKTLLQSLGDFFIMQSCQGFGLTITMLLICFKCAKSRETLLKQLSQMFALPTSSIKADPPKNRSVPVALYFYKSTMSGSTYQFGDLPDWLAKQLSLSHQTGSENFELSKMVQWAYDNDYKDEASIAFFYAQEADNDANAAAWLKHNGQARFVKDCCQMVRLYKRQEMKQMTLSQWVSHCCNKTPEEGDWRDIAKFLKFQDVNFLHFLGVMRQFLAHTPKKSCLLIYGPPDTGKSTFLHTLVQFLQGAVISFVNCKSHFWLMPLVDAKVGFLDDATHLCFQYMDQHMRCAFDGYPVSVDCKHRVPTQIKMPPMLMTSNLNIYDDPLYFYLQNRITGIPFHRKFPFNEDGSPCFSLTVGSWRSFFKKLHQQLGLEEEDFSQDAEPTHTLRCSARSPVRTL